MPVHSQKKDTTPNTPGSTQEQTAPPLPEQQEFHQHLRELAQSAVRTVLELVMREELDAFIGAAWGVSSPKRKGYRNGTSTRDLGTSTGRLQDIKVPRDREGLFHTQVFDRYQRYERRHPDCCVGMQRREKTSSLRLEPFCWPPQIPLDAPLAAAQEKLFAAVALASGAA